MKTPFPFREDRGCLSRPDGVAGELHLWVSIQDRGFHLEVNGRWKTFSTFFEKPFGTFIKIVSHFDGVCWLRPYVL
jgi:hypothetical protein